jgi:hypothetical protein
VPRVTLAVTFLARSMNRARIFASRLDRRIAEASATVGCQSPFPAHPQSAVYGQGISGGMGHPSAGVR